MLPIHRNPIWPQDQPGDPDQRIGPGFNGRGKTVHNNIRRRLSMRIQERRGTYQTSKFAIGESETG